MTKLDSSVAADRKNTGFSESLSHERHHRTALVGLRDLVVFHQALKKEMKAIEDSVARGLPMDRDLYQKMVAVDEKYKEVMTGFMHLNDDHQRHIMIIFADAVKDMMAHIHHKGKH